MEHLPQAAPVLASLNIDKTVQFYQEQLGFTKLDGKIKIMSLLQEIVLGYISRNPTTNTS